MASSLSCRSFRESRRRSRRLVAQGSRQDPMRRSNTMPRPRPCGQITARLRSRLDAVDVEV